MRSALVMDPLWLGLLEPFVLSKTRRYNTAINLSAKLVGNAHQLLMNADCYEKTLISRGTNRNIGVKTGKIA